MLLAALRDLRARGVLQVDLVCHSMGGLVARDALTRTSGYGGNSRSHLDLPEVDRLILVATPNAGSQLARLHPVTDAREQFVRWIGTQGHDPAVLLGFLKDGSGEAAEDLLPGSLFLSELNARPLPTGARITCIVAVTGEGVRDRLQRSLASTWVKKFLSDEEVAGLGRSLAEASQAVGDGCVSESSATLPGVADVVRVQANHQSVLKPFEVLKAAGLSGGEPAPAIPVILERLARPVP